MKYQKYLEAIETLSKIEKERSKYLIIHYACESFYNSEIAKTPRIGAIAVRFFDSGQTYSFSMHKSAEILKIDPEDIPSKYDEVEFAMLTDFAKFLKEHKDYKWIHWNMRDGNYGFQAISHRYRVLQNKLVKGRSIKVEMLEINDSNKVDLAMLLINKYGVRYVGNPRMQKLVEINNLSPKDFLTGEDEAKAFSDNDFHKLLMSTLEKVSLLSIFTQRAIDNDLKHNGKFLDVCDDWKTSLVKFLTGNIYGIVISLVISALLGHYIPKLINWCF